MIDPTTINWFQDLTGVVQVVLSAVCAYVALIIFLRLFGKRTLTQLSAFDFIVTIALGSMLSATILDNSLPKIDALAGLFTLICMQFVLTWLSVRLPFVDRLIKSRPATLVDNGAIDGDRARKERITIDEISSALRRSHVQGLEGIESVTLETNGKLTVVYKNPI